LSGRSAIIETIFQVPGIGNDLINGDLQPTTLPLVEGITLVFALVTVLGQPARRPGLRSTRPEDPVWPLQLPDMTRSRRPAAAAVAVPRQRAASAAKPAGEPRALRLWVPAGILIAAARRLLHAGHYVGTRCPSSTNGSILSNQEPPFSPGHVLGTDVSGRRHLRPCWSTAGRSRSRSASPSRSSAWSSAARSASPPAYFGGWADAIMSRIIDVLIAFPALVLALAVAEVLAAERART
jgi:ABC-type dipeptide/oligopeptide/nickel transport system permease subunit